MLLRPLERGAEAFQRPVPAEEIRAMCVRTLGVDARSATELGNGMYNNTYAVEPVTGPAVILRVAPEPGRQFRIERGLMRAEYATAPFLVGLGPLVPRILAADFTHELIGRDYLFQTMLEGVPGPEGLRDHPRSRWTSFYHDLGSIARRIHAVRGTAFGPVAGPLSATWSAALLRYFVDLAADLEDAGLYAGDVRAIGGHAVSDRAVLDEITEPRLLHGDLWTINVMMAADAPEPRVTGVFDNDRTWWGDPAADWPVFQAGRRPGTGRDAFWDTYGPLADGPAARRRALYYRARHFGAIRLEHHRLARAEDEPSTYEALRRVLAELSA